MKTEYWTKQKLYEEVDKLKYNFGLDFSYEQYPINSIELGKKYCKNLIIEEISFSNSQICGILYKGNYTTSIALNSSRDFKMQNFDCMHELIHYFFHNISYCQLMCSEKNIKQDAYIEWQANEGAAQFLVPYQLFIPKYIELEKKYAHSFWEDDSIEELSEYFHVSYKVIQNRISSLETEIWQYENGQNIKSLALISKSKVVRLGLDKLKAKQLYCKTCLNIILNEYNYCPICGNDLINHSIFRQKKRKGAGFMIYKNEIELDENKKAKICPKCQNEEILEGSYCKICGLNLFNKCDSHDVDNLGNIYETCGEICDGNARYCHKCGSKTTWYNLNLIHPYDKESNNSYDAPHQNDDDLPF